MELVTETLPPGEYLEAISGIVEFLRAEEVEEVFVAYGFGCDCPDEQLYKDVLMPLDRIMPYIAEAEDANFYRLGKDNFHVKDISERFEFMFCHESDIHFFSEDATLVEGIKARWNAKGYKTFVKLNAEWRFTGDDNAPT